MSFTPIFNALNSLYTWLFAAMSSIWSLIISTPLLILFLSLAIAQSLFKYTHVLIGKKE